ncbi:Demethylmenaquinone methyltransferase [Rhypophila sp. PSN 637]
MSFMSGRSLDNYEFTFEKYLTDSNRIEADSNEGLSSHHGRMDTLSITESIAASEERFGRTYHSYRSGSYNYPNDPTEIERLDDQHEIMKLVMDGRNYLAPFSKEKPPKNILDIATGTGTWAIEMGDEFPEAKIVGTDLSPIQPQYVPLNVRFFIEDSTEEWDYPERFDYIHTRVTLGCWSDMKTQIIQKAYDNLEPGGWLECQELECLPGCDDGTMTEGHAWLDWAIKLCEASEVINRQLNMANQIKGWMEEVGFVDVQEMVFKIPTNGWPKDRRLKYLGLLWQRNVMTGLSGFTLDLFNRVLGKTMEEIEVDLINVRKSLFNRQVHSYQRVICVWGRKPDDSEMRVA